MSRIVRTNENRSGQTFDASGFPEGHLRRSYMGHIDFRGATIIGDIRGSDLLECDFRNGADLSRAQTYGCVWTGSLVDETTIFPAEVGGLQMLVTLELVRRRVAQLPQAYRQRARGIVQALREGRYLDSQAIIRDILSTQRGREVAQKLLGYLSTHPGIAQRVKDLFGFCAAERCEIPRSVATLDWHDGTVVAVDRDNLPPLPRPDDRYELDQWIVAQTEPASHLLGSRSVYTASIRPRLAIYILARPDDWLWSLPRKGY